jgi:hypothetical protein
MPDLTGLPALDVAIGLSFVFLLLSLLASAVQELLANLFALRAKTLEKGLRNMLADPAPAPDTGKPGLLAVKGDDGELIEPDDTQRDLVFAVYTHPLIRTLYRDGRKWLWFGRTSLTPAADTAEADAETKQKQAAKAAAEAAGGSAKDVAKAEKQASTAFGARLPSYIAPRSFALALLDTISPDVALTGADGSREADQDVIRKTREAIAGLGIPPGVKHRLLALLDDARGNMDAFRLNVEAWFDDTMARVSGWYKRTTQLIIALVAVVVTVAMNANALTMGERLWRDPTLRAAVAQQAGTATGSTEGTTARERVNNAVANVEDVTQLGAPIGWAQSNPNDPRHVDLGNLRGLARGVSGWLLTVLALSLGAPFWFDTLSRLSRLRGSGKPETPLPASGRGLPGERVVTPGPPVSVSVQHAPTLAAAAVGPSGNGQPPSDPGSNAPEGG